MKIILSILLFGISQFGISQTAEIKQFYLDIFHDSSVYTFKDYEQDSIKTVKEIESSPFLQSIFGKDPTPLLSEYKCKIDTTQSAFRIINHCGAYHFDRFVVFEKFFSFHENKNLEVLGEIGDFLKEIQNDSNFTDPITQDKINAYYETFKKLKTSDFNLDFEVISNSEFNSLVKKKKGYSWKKYYKKYESPLVEISIPFINKSRDYGIFEYWVTFQRLGGYQYRGTYKKINGKWKALNVVKIAVS